MLTTNKQCHVVIEWDVAAFNAYWLTWFYCMRCDDQIVAFVKFSPPRLEFGSEFCLPVSLSHDIIISRLPDLNTTTWLKVAQPSQLPGETIKPRWESQLRMSTVAVSTSLSHYKPSKSQNNIFSIMHLVVELMPDSTA